MEKKIWTKPCAVIEQFEMNEYIAACGDKWTVYNFVCDAPGGTLYYYPQGDGEVDGEYTGSGEAVRLGSYHPCDASHEASTTNPFYDGFVDRGSKKNPANGVCDPGEEVIVWRGPQGNNGHATAKLDMSSWETTKS